MAPKSSLAQFLQRYATPSEKGRFFTRSQLFIGYRAYLSRIKSSELLSMDYGVFSSEFEEEIKNVELQTKFLGRSKYYKLFKLENSESDTKKSGGLSVNDKQKVNLCLNDLNIYLCCKLCCGYLVDATTVTECLHSFCKSCIVKYLQVKLSCPLCNAPVHSSNPYSSLKSDIVLQDVVDKLLPGVAENERERMHEFEQRFQTKEDNVTSSSKRIEASSMVTVVVEWVGSDTSTLPAEDLVQKYIRISDGTTVAHLSQFVLQKLGKVDSSVHPCAKCEILSGGVALPPILTIRDIIENELAFESRKGLPLFHYDLKPLG